MDVPEQLEGKAENEIKAPEEIMNILKRSCYVCHSNSLVYPWYDKIAPASWYAKNHVKNGRKTLNFSLWSEYTKEEQLKLLDNIPKSIAIRMPLPSYLWLHEEATLTKEEKQKFSKWVKKLKEEVK
ncbi:heme-binding domain-containing protein [bacterium]|nr:heme-binding domain-containing protein [bacterium]MBU1957578.1 heme-binding domain-containing protein [bacterium]